MTRLLTIPLAATLAIATLPAGAAFAVTAYDARTLGMGGSSVGYSGNASLAYWNPASVGMSRNVGVYLPSLGVSMSNNILSPADVQNLASTFSKLGQPSTGASSTSGDLSAIFKNLGSNAGLNLQAEGIAELVGLSLGRVGPGALAFRVYGHGLGNASLKLSNDFADNLNGLFFAGGFTELSSAVSKLSQDTQGGSFTAESQAQLNTDVAALDATLKKNMSSFIKAGGTGYTKKTLAFSETVGANATAALTYAQPIPIKIPALPNSEITVGVTGKVFGNAGSLFAAQTSLPLYGGTGSEKVNMLGAGANISLDIDKEVTELSGAIGNFQKEQNIATTADLASKAGAFFGTGLTKSQLNFTSLTPDSLGGGIDVGAAMKIDDQWSVGLALINPILVWGATQSSYRYEVSPTSTEGIRLVKAGADQRVNFYQAEPFITRAGVAYQPKLGGPAWLAKGLLLNAGLEAPFGNGVPASVHLGVEKTFFDAIALRLGTQQLGLSPLYTAGLGLQTRFFQANVGVGVDNPTANIKGVAVAASVGAGF
ncbi:MAG: hypothetical protein JWM80_2078 [Cyanobacteria bacterium RYN_339]|nr:hypothetical protein [Cyanobacteria bacterium RYN_339]